MVRISSSLRPWHLGAAALMALALFLGQSQPAHAAMTLAVTLNDTAAGANTDATMVITLEDDLNPNATITITFPLGWVVPDGALTSIGTAGFGTPPVSFTGNATNRTVAILTGGPQFAALGDLTLTFNPTGEIKNTSTLGLAAVTVDANDGVHVNGQGSANVTITAAAPVVTGGAVTLTTNLAGANTTGTIAFTLGAALAQNDVITLTFPVGWTIPGGALTTANWTLSGATVSSVGGSALLSQVALTIGAGGVGAGAHTITIAGSQLQNTALPNASNTIGIAAPGHTAGTSTAFSIAGPVSAANSTVDASLASVLADGSTASTITVTLKDATNILVKGQTVTLAQGAGASVISAASGVSSAAGVVTFTVTNTTVQNVTYTATSGVAITDTASVNFTAVVAGALTATNVQPASLVAGVTGNATVSLTPTSAVQNNGKIKVTFPAGFDVSGATFGSVGGALDGTATVSVAGQVVTITRTGGTAFGLAGSVTLGGIKNPNAAGSTGTYTITTTNAADVTIDTDAAVAADTIVAGPANKLQLLVPGETASPGSVSGKTGTPSGQLTGTAFNVTVRMVDANWNLVTSTDTIAITTSGTGTMPTNAALVGGTQTFSVTITVAGSPTLTATDVTDGAKTASTSPAITVTAPPPPQPENDPDPGPSNNPPGFNPFIPQPLTCDAGFTLVNGVCVPIPSSVTLSSLSVVGATLSPAFNSGTTSYTVTVPATQQTLSVTAAASNVTHGVLIGTRAGTGSLTFEETLAQGTTDISVHVVSPDQQRTIYTITVNRAPTLPLRFVSSTSRTVTVSVTTSVNEQVRVIPRAVGAPAPSWVNAYTGLGSLVGSPPVHDVVAGQAKEFEVTGLSPGTTYDFYAASESGLVSAKVTATTLAASVLTSLSVAPRTTSGLDLDVSKWITVPLVDGRTAYTVQVTPGASYGVVGEAGSATIQYSTNGSVSNPFDLSVTAPAEVSLAVTNGPTYTVTLSAGVTCLNGGTAFGSFCTCPTGYTGSQCQIPPTAVIPFGAITLSSNVASATAVTATVAFTTPVSIPIGGKIKVEMTGFSWPAAPAAQFIAEQGVTTVGSASFASNVLTVTTSTAAIGANRTVVLTVTGATNPSAAQLARSDVAMSVTDSADAVLASTSTATLVTITSGISQLTGASVTPWNTAAGASDVRYEVIFTTPVAIPSRGQIRVAMPGVTLPASPSATFTMPSALANAASFANGTLTITLAGGSSASEVRLLVSGGTNPAAAQAALSNLRFEVTDAAGTVLASTSTGTMSAIESGITNVSFRPSSTVARARVEIEVTFTPATALVGGDVISFNLGEWIIPSSGVAASVSQSGGVPFDTSGSTAGGLLILPIPSGSSVQAKQAVTVRLPGFTNPGATILKDRLTVQTTKDRTAVAAGADVAIRALAKSMRLTTTRDGLTVKPVVTFYLGDDVDTSVSGSVDLELGSEAIAAGREAKPALASATATRGVATFDDITVTGYGTYTLTASATGYTSVQATVEVSAVSGVRFSVADPSPGASTTMTVSFKSEASLLPGNTIDVRIAEGYFFPAGSVTVTAVSGFTGMLAPVSLSGAVAAGANDTIRVTLGSGTSFEGTGKTLTLSFAVTNPAARDIASDLLTVKTGSTPTAVAADGPLAIGATKTMRFTTQPSANAAAGVDLTEQPVVTFYVGNDIDTSYTGQVTLQLGSSDTSLQARIAAGISSGTLPKPATMTATASAGVARFAGIRIPEGMVSGLVSTGPFALEASAIGYTSVRSTDINIGGALSVQIVAPASTTQDRAVVTNGNTSTTLAGGFGTLRLTTTVTGQGGATPSYAWAVTGDGCSVLVGVVLSSSNLSPFVADDPTTCTFTVTVTAGSATATASHTIEFTAEAKPRLEIVGAPTGTFTATPLDLDLTVRVLNADGSLNTGFAGNVTLSAKASGRTFPVGRSRVSNGVAQFDKTWTPELADATWVLAARATGYDEVTSNEFSVTKPKSLKFSTQPGGATAGNAFTTQPVVRAYQADGVTVDTTFTGSVSLALKPDTANGATLTSPIGASGLELSAFGGQATAAGVRINNAGTKYVLVASTKAPGYADVASEEFDVTSAPIEIVIYQSTNAGAVGKATPYEIHAAAIDANGNPVPGAAGGLGLLVNNDTARQTSRIASTPDRIEKGVAIFTGTWGFELPGQHRWGVDVSRSAGFNLPQADTEAFTVTGRPHHLAFVQPPGGFGSVLGTQPVVEIQDSADNRVPGATDEVRLTFTGPDGWVMSGGTATADAGTATFTGVGFTGGTTRGDFVITARSGDLETARAVIAPAGPTTSLRFSPAVTVPSTINRGKLFSLKVEATDASSNVNAQEDGTVTLTSDGNGMARARTARFVEGVASFPGLSFESVNSTGFTLTATLGTMTVSSTKIKVTPDTTPAFLNFDPVLARVRHNEEFQLRVHLFGEHGGLVGDPGGQVTLRLGKTDGTTTSTLGGTVTRPLDGSTATFTDLTISGADTGLSLTATLTGGSSGLSVRSTMWGTLEVLRETVVSPSASVQQPDQAARTTFETDFKSSMATILNVAADQITITDIVAGIGAVDGDDRITAAAAVQALDAREVAVRFGSIHLATFESILGAAAPPGASALFGVGRVATDAFGNRLDVLSRSLPFAVSVPKSAVMVGVLPGDLKVVWWDGARWTMVPSATAVNFDGSFTVTANTDALGVFAVLYAPGAGRIQGLARYSEDGAGFGVFSGGGVATLAHAAGLNEASGAWVQDSTGAYRLLVVGGPAFLATEFAARFPDGIAPSTAVTLVQARPATSEPLASTVASSAPAPVAAAAPAVRTGTPLTSATYAVTAADTLSEIAVRYGLEQSTLAEANGIAGPNYVVRTGQVLTIPSGGRSLVSHTVSGTDTLSSIGTLYGVRWPDIAAMNNIAGPNYVVRPGQVLTIAR